MPQLRLQEHTTTRRSAGSECAAPVHRGLRSAVSTPPEDGSARAEAAWISRARLCLSPVTSKRCNACQLTAANGGLTQSAPNRPRVRLSPKHNTSQDAECTMLLMACPRSGRQCACQCACDRRVVTFCTAWTWCWLTSAVVCLRPSFCVHDSDLSGCSSSAPALAPFIACQNVHVLNLWCMWRSILSAD
jgi:hypothetical protein